VRFLLSFIIFLLVFNPVFSQDGSIDSTLDISRICPVHTKDEALERASLFTGFQEKTATKSLSENDVKLITLVDTTTPFIADSINGRVAWQINFKNVILDLKRTLEEDELKNPRNFEVLIDSINGQLLEIRSRYAGNSDSLARYPTSGESTL